MKKRWSGFAAAAAVVLAVSPAWAASTTSPEGAPAATPPPESSPSSPPVDELEDDWDTTPEPASSEPVPPVESGKRPSKLRAFLTRLIRHSGYVQPELRFLYRPEALPRDRWELGAGATQGGLVFSGSPFKHWSYTIHVVIGAEILEVITDVELVDSDGDGAPDEVSSTSRPVPGIFIEELSVSYAPIEWLRFVLGQMRIPFTVQHRSSNTALMFPHRSGPNKAFLKGTDLGLLATASPWSGRLEASVGIFNGTGFAAGLSNERGLLLSARLDLSPLGAMPFAEGDLDRGPFRFGIGAGLLYQPSWIFDDSGFSSSRARDLRLSASVRVAARGFYLQVELLRRQRTDSLSSRPEIATGLYAQASFFFLVYKRFGLAPVGRIGWTAEDQGFDPRVTLFVEAGIGFYLGSKRLGPDAFRVIVQYLGERRITEGENAHGTILQLQLRW